MTPIRVLHVIGSGTVGGAEDVVVRLADYQKRCEPGIAPTVFFRVAQGRNYDRAVGEGIEALAGSRDGRILGIWRCARIFRRFDVLHFHGLYPSLFAAAVLSHRPSIFFLHGARALTRSIPDAVRGAVSPKQDRRRPTIAGGRRLLKRWALVVFLRRFVTEVQVPSRFMARFCREVYKVPERKIQVIPLGLDETEWTKTDDGSALRMRLGIRPTAKVVGCVATFRPVKRIDRMIAAFARLAYANPAEDLRLILVGDGEERPKLEALVRDKGLASRVVFAGMSDDVCGFLGLMDVFVQPSEREAFSVAMIEAMACRRPIVAFRGSGGAEEMIEASGGGLLARDEGEMARLIRRLLDDPAEAERLGQNGRCFVTIVLTMEAFAAAMQSSCERAAARKSKE
jgi:glycosyltransferase involved in cell wall biosynthesis